MKTFVIQNQPLPEEYLKEIPPHFAEKMQKGWGNGYIAIPEGHPLHRKGVGEISVAVHGGITLAAEPSLAIMMEFPEVQPTDWILGFDTMHNHDTLQHWTKERVEAETLHMKHLIENGEYKIYSDEEER